jgi:tetratricopeptide (TPR) repeat protein
VRGDIVFAHAFDFIAYARLQRGEDKQVFDDLAALKDDNNAPVIVQARYPLERGDWLGSAAVSVPTGDPFDVALARFARAYGAARSGDARNAEIELKALQATRPLVRDSEGEYWAVFVDIYAKTVDAWLARAKGKDAEALALMQQAAAMDDGHEKHIYLENKILPIRASLGDMPAGLGHPAEALAAYEASLKLAPNRYRAFLGAAKAAEALGDKAATRAWYQRLVDLSGPGDKARPGFVAAQAYLATNG